MQRKTVLTLGALALAGTVVYAACEQMPSSALSAPEHISRAASQDLDGTPDLVVDTRVLSSSWIVLEETFT